MTHRIGDSFILAAIACALAACGGGGGGGAQSGGTSSASVPTTTRAFDNDDFTQVEINNSFAFIIQQGEQFSIEVTIDSDDMQHVRVRQDGTILRVEFDPTFSGDIRTQVARGIITMPLLDQVGVSGSAFVDVAGFNQSYLEIVQAGSSHVEVSNSRFDMVTALLAGNSHLSLTNAAPVAAAHADVMGSSQATFSLMDGGTLTGSASGSSNISYFGRSVTAQVATFNTATVTWLGVDPV